LKPKDSNAGRFAYRVLNRIFLLVLILIFSYSALFSPEKKNHPIPSGSRFFTGTTVTSTGLSRSFSAIIRLRFDEARRYNQHGIRLFLFFLIQLFMRIAALNLSGRLPVQFLRPLYYSDAVLSVGLFIACFWPFLTSFYMNMSCL
jgi:hypothetical protein